MPWFKVDDNLAFHAKVVMVGNAAMGLWVRAGSWSAQQLTDGFVPDHIVTTLGTRGQAKNLAEVGLWSRAEGGYLFHDWQEYQPTRENVEKDRSEARERMRKAREARRGSADVRANTERTSGDVRLTRPDPSRPDPSSKELEGGSHVSRGSAAHPPLFPDHCEAHADEPTPPPCGRCKDKREHNRNGKVAIPTLQLITSQMPPWCGRCAHTTDRHLETPLGVIRCPECNPLAVEASA